MECTGLPHKNVFLATTSVESPEYGNWSEPVCFWKQEPALLIWALVENQFIAFPFNGTGDRVVELLAFKKPGKTIYQHHPHHNTICSHVHQRPLFYYSWE